MSVEYIWVGILQDEVLRYAYILGTQGVAAVAGSLLFALLTVVALRPRSRPGDEFRRRLALRGARPTVSRYARPGSSVPRGFPWSGTRRS